MDLKIDLDSADSYRTFLKVKGLPRYRFQGRVAIVPDEYAHLVGTGSDSPLVDLPYEPLPGLFDYQRDIARIAIRRGRFCVFADPGTGKSLIDFEFARHVSKFIGEDQAILIVCPIMVIDQMIGEARKFYGDSLPIDRIPARELAWWTLHGKGKVGITNYEALSDKVSQGRIAGLIVSESSMLKSAYGVWGQHCLRLGKGLRWILCESGTPAPNDRTEFGNHAIIMGAFPTLNAFYSRFFVNKGTTGERWIMKPHAVGPFYRSLSDWCIFLTNPAVYGWRDNVGGWPPINVHIEDVELTAEQSEIANEINGTLFPIHVGGITKRSRMGQLSKGKFREKDGTARDVSTMKFDWIRDRVESFGGKSCIIWCRYDDEQSRLERCLDGVASFASLKGSTSQNKRQVAIGEFREGKIQVLISKSKILGFGLNLQIARHHIFSTLQDSYEEYRQCVGRSNRYGSTDTLDVWIPVTELERPMVESVLVKAARVQADAAEQEILFQGSVAGGVFHAT